MFEIKEDSNGAIKEQKKNITMNIEKNRKIVDMNATLSVKIIQCKD